MKEIEKLFTEIGGRFIVPASEIISRLEKIKLLVFDWDGVFNDGMKVVDQSSTFSEIDSMGTNMLRFSFWLKNREMPLSCIITGANNRMAEFLSKRECFNYLFLKNKNKTKSLDSICEKHNLNYENIAFFFDDILDLDVAEKAGLRLMVSRKSSPLFDKYVYNHSLCDYKSGKYGNKGAVREICELLMGLNGNYTQCIDERRRFGDIYTSYLDVRNSCKTEIITDNSRDI